MTAFTLFGAVLLFLVGLRLSAFFSGSETGFYRVNFLRLSIDAQAGDATAKRLVWFLRNPGNFVATTLVGNNIANYITTIAIGLISVHLISGDAGRWEVLLTLLVSPLIFILGELIPKSLYYRAPRKLLQRDSKWFSLFYRLFLPFSFPLILIARFMNRFSGSDDQTMELVFGRKRLVQVLSAGHREGLLSDVQNRLVTSLLEVATQPVTESMTATKRVAGMPDSATREDLKEHARRHGQPNVPLFHASEADSWFGYIRIVDVSLKNRPLASLIHEMPVVDSSDCKLEAMVKLREASAVFGLVQEDGRTIGIVDDRSMTESLFQSTQLIRNEPAQIPS
jgi:putative hemolysin